MRIRPLSVAVLVALLVASLASRGGTTEPSPVSAELHARAAARSTARVIVRLNVPFSPEAQLASPAHVVSQPCRRPSATSCEGSSTGSCATSAAACR